MTLKVVTHFSTLMQLAGAVGKAKRNGDQEQNAAEGE